MRITLSIARREIAGFFYSPIAYVVMCLFMLLAGLFFLLTVFRPGDPASLRMLFFWLVWILVAIVPAISMRLVSEELRAGTVETLVTAPVTDAQVVVGKWLGGLGFFAVLLLPTMFSSSAWRSGESPTTARSSPATWGCCWSAGSTWLLEPSHPCSRGTRSSPSSSPCS
ncbi:MAG: ABC transporter permease [Phycisphaerae bacterium]|nr:ABC transporter permease [Phycisphaerae bacterium]